MTNYKHNPGWGLGIVVAGYSRHSEWSSKKYVSKISFITFTGHAALLLSSSLCLIISNFEEQS